MPSVPAQRFRGPLLPDGEARDLYVVDGRITYEAQPGADTVAEGWIVPGLVDAHCHLGLDDFGATDDAATEQQAIDDRDGGALLIRDAGSAADTRWIHDRDDLPRLIRVRAPHRRDEALHPQLRPRGGARRRWRRTPPRRPATATAGSSWSGDWISREEGDLAPSFPAEAVRRRDRGGPRPRREGHRALLRPRRCSRA